MDEQITENLKYIRLWGLLANWDRYLEMARKRNFSHVRLLKYIIEGNYSPGRSAINSRTHIPVHDVEIFQQNA